MSVPAIWSKTVRCLPPYRLHFTNGSRAWLDVHIPLPLLGLMFCMAYGCCCTDCGGGGGGVMTWKACWLSSDTLGKRDFPFSSPVHPNRLWSQPSLLSNGYRRFFARNHLHPVPRFKNVWSCTSTSPYVFMVLWLVKHGDKFTKADVQKLPRDASFLTGLKRLILLTLF